MDVSEWRAHPLDCQLEPTVGLGPYLDTDREDCIMGRSSPGLTLEKEAPTGHFHPTNLWDWGKKGGKLLPGPAPAALPDSGAPAALPDSGARAALPTC